MLCSVAAVKGWPVEDRWVTSSESETPEEAAWGAVRRLEENWKLFERGGHKPYVKRKERRQMAIEDWEADESHGRDERL